MSMSINLSLTCPSLWAVGCMCVDTKDIVRMQKGNLMDTDTDTASKV